MYPHKGIHGDENNVCFMTDDCISPLLPLALLMWHVRLLSLVLLCHKHEILSCFFVKVSFQWHRLKIKIVCARWAWLTNVRQVTVRRPWNFLCIHSSYWLELSVSILQRKESYIFVGSCPVSVVSSSGTIYTEPTLSHPLLDVESTPYFEMNVESPEVGFVETRKFVLYWRWWPITSKELRSELVLYQEVDLNRSEFRTDLTNSWEIWQRRHEISVTRRRFQQTQGNLSFKNREFWKILKWKRTNLNVGKTEADFKSSLIIFYRTDSDSEKELESYWASGAHAKGCSELFCFEEVDCIAQTRNSSSRRKMEQLNSGDWRRNSKSNFPNSVHWSIRFWIDQLQKEEDERRYFSFVLIILGQKFFTSELSNVIRRKILRIRLCWITFWFQITF